ncbi:cilia- and flagella-associated protein 77-like [Actinia tenebrosa]|uniref:Cilia- and flagella-associated protein 77-like n=1 Tax=Actinia tenebrosa TaxID=6105 RepID=A0A6P8I9R0_ACTTE|nr:cilia- and flagella-associated protein 77-like [Actinia tenebrosa]
MSNITLGVQRESLINNPLLQKVELGRPLRRCFTLPHDGFTYGKPNDGKTSGAADALVWRTAPVQTTFQRKEKKAPRDFQSLNKSAVQVGLTTAQEHFQYRATHDVRKAESGTEKTIQKLKRLPPTMVFGVPTRPSTPVYDLLGHKYQDRWLEERHKAEETMRARQIQKRHVDKNIYETRASLLRKFQPPVDPPPFWQMSKFQKIPSQIESFRTDKAKTGAFKHHATDSTSRKGAFGHGIYEPAKS